MEYKTIYRGKELPFVDYFESKKEALTKEFLAQYPDFCSTEVLNNSEIMQSKATAAFSTTRGRGTAWKLLNVKGQHYGDAPYFSTQPFEESKAKFPTMTSFIDYFGFENLGSVTYSILEANGIIARHTGPANREGKFIRYHIPLIVPEGDLGMEINGEVVDWSEPFGFDNQTIHSVWNNTDYRRLILMIDLRRSYLGLPDAPHWTEEAEIEANKIPFAKTHNKVPGVAEVRDRMAAAITPAVNMGSSLKRD